MWMYRMVCIQRKWVEISRTGQSFGLCKGNNVIESVPPIRKTYRGQDFYFDVSMKIRNKPNDALRNCEKFQSSCKNFINP